MTHLTSCHNDVDKAPFHCFLVIIPHFHRSKSDYNIYILCEGVQFLKGFRNNFPNQKADFRVFWSEQANKIQNNMKVLNGKGDASSLIKTEVLTPTDSPETIFQPMETTPPPSAPLEMVPAPTRFYVPIPEQTNGDNSTYIQVVNFRPRHDTENIDRPSIPSSTGGDLIDIRSKQKVPPKLLDCISRMRDDKKIGQDVVKALENFKSTPTFEQQSAFTANIFSQLKAANLVSQRPEMNQNGQQFSGLSGPGDIVWGPRGYQRERSVPNKDLKRAPYPHRKSAYSNDSYNNTNQSTTPRYSHSVPPSRTVTTDSSVPMETETSTPEMKPCIQTDGHHYFQQEPQTKMMMSKRWNMDTYYSTGRSQILIINNKFDRPESNQGRRFRSGADTDLKNFFRLFQDVLNYSEEQITYAENVKSTELDAILHLFKEKCMESKSESFIVVVMTHGGSEPDSLLMDDLETVDVHRDLVYKFDHVHFPYFIGKPKIFLLEACRSHTSHPSSSRPTTHHSPFLEFSPMTDVLVGQSTVPFSLSYRHNKEGSLYVRAIMEIFTQNHNHLDIRTMLEMCTSKVMEYVGSYQETSSLKLPIQIPTVQTMGFVKRFYFNRYHSSDSEFEPGASGSAF